MKKIINLLIISLLLNSCNHPDEYLNSNVSQENRTDIKIQGEGEKNHTSSKALNDSNYKEDLDINKLKEIIWQELKDFKTFKVYMKTKKFNIWIDQMDDGSYRYASWSKSKKIDEKPDIILKNGSVTYEGSARNHWYTFKNADVKYICDINVLGKAYDEAFLPPLSYKCDSYIPGYSYIELSSSKLSAFINKYIRFFMFSVNMYLS